MGRKAKPTSIEDAIERLQSKLVEALAKADPTKKSPASVLNILHALYAAQAGLALSSSEPVSGQTLSATGRFLAANSVKRTPSMYGDDDDDDEDEGDNFDEPHGGFDHAVDESAENPFAK